MAKVYDPIMCMMVEQKTNDANKYVEQAIKMMKENKGRLEILSTLKHMGLTPSDAAQYYAEANTELGYKYSAKDQRTVDKEREPDIWFLVTNGKWLHTFRSNEIPMNEAKKWMKENGVKTAKLARSGGSSSGFTVSANDARTCDADPVFKNIYNSFTSSVNSSRKMDPKAANAYVGKIMKGYIDDLDKAFRAYNQEYNEIRERIMREGQKEMSDIFERYLKEGKK